MVNVLKQGGLRLVDAVNGAGSGEEIVLIPSSDSNPTGQGDPLQLIASSGGSIGQGEVVAECNLGSATSVVYAVALSLLPQYTDGTAQMTLNQTYRSASVAMYALARIANNQDVWEISDDGASAGLASGHMNYNYKFVANICTTGSATNGLSQFVLDSANGATTATFPFSVIGPSKDPSNDPTLVNASWRGNLNNVKRAGGTGTLGV